MSYSPFAGVGSGVGSGVAEFEGSELSLSPSELIAITEKVYGWPTSNPEKVQDVRGGIAEQVSPPGSEVTIYSSMGK